VARVEPSAFTKISALGVEEQRVNVLIAPTASGPAWSRLSDGYRANARIEVWSRPEVLKVSLAALFRKSSDWYVFVVDKGKAVQRAIRLGERGDREAEVLSGIEERSLVILYPSDKIRDGVRVQQEAEAPR
jgi:HlyD family secretion protein